MPTLDWIGKDKVINHHKDVPYKVLERKYSFDESGMHKEDIHSNNMIIHGDNLEALKSLLPQYEGKIKCIYIDPPYNTGNEGWIYNDNVNDPKIRKWLGEVVGKEGEDLSRHDKWLCMMYPRLVLLQKLLADDGAIFISIDDNEQAFLKCVCDEIFGARNFVAQLVWQRTFATKNDAKYFSSEHEYILVYAAEIEKLKIKALPKSDKQLERYKNPDNDPRGPWISTDLLRMEHRDNSVYEVPTPQGKLYKPQPGTSWRHPKEEMMALIKNNEVWFGANGNSKPRRKKFLADVKSGIIPQTIWKHVDVGHTQEAKQQLKKILDASTDFFATPKPIRLINQILRIICDDGDIVLDSFAGSATTAHAVMQSDLKLSYIMIEVEDYADTITAERVKRVIDGYGEGKNRKKFFDTSKYKSYLVSNNEKVKYIFENFLVDKWLREDRKLNNYVHANGIRFVMDNYVYQNKKEDKHKELIETLQNITDIFLSLLSVIDSIKFHSSDYLDALEMEMKPQEGSQYWVCPIIVEYMNDRFDKKLLQYIQNNEGNGMQFMAEYYNQNKG